jgi:hypothetical protein
VNAPDSSGSAMVQIDVGYQEKGFVSLPGRFVSFPTAFGVPAGINDFNQFILVAEDRSFMHMFVPPDILIVQFPIQIAVF